MNRDRAPWKIALATVWVISFLSNLGSSIAIVGEFLGWWDRI